MTIRRRHAARLPAQEGLSPSTTIGSPIKRRDYARKDAEVLAAADSIFMQVGYAMTSMDEVARLADVSKRTIYSNFASKDDLFAAVIRKRCADILPDPKLVAKARTVEVAEGLRLLSRAFLKSILSRPKIELYQTIIDAARHRPDLGRILFDGPVAGSHKLFGDYLREQVAGGSLVIDDVERATGQLIGLLKSDLHMLLLFSQDVRITSKAITDHVESSVDLFLRGTVADRQLADLGTASPWRLRPRRNDSEGR